LVYIGLSVIPQEFLYRTLFFRRYKQLFSNKWVFFAVNCVLFSFAHIWLQSYVVLLFTFVGGIFYFLTYNHTRSLLFVCIEHAAYGLWLFTVGFGELFNFPV
jgi:membrane protease YdiL (CAAX protease family)